MQTENVFWQVDVKRLLVYWNANRKRFLEVDIVKRLLVYWYSFVLLQVRVIIIIRDRYVGGILLVLLKVVVYIFGFDFAFNPQY